MSSSPIVATFRGWRGSWRGRCRRSWWGSWPRWAIWTDCWTVGCMSDSPDILHSLHLLFDNTFVYNAKQVHFAYLPVCGTYVFEVAEMCLVEPKIHPHGKCFPDEGDVLTVKDYYRFVNRVLSEIDDGKWWWPLVLWLSVSFYRNQIMKIYFSFFD